MRHGNEKCFGKHRNQSNKVEIPNRLIRKLGLNPNKEIVARRKVVKPILKRPYVKIELIEEIDI